MIVKIGAITFLHPLRTLPCISSGPLALLGLMFPRSFSTPLTCILMGLYQVWETLEHYILNCSALDSVRLPILNQISISYKNLSGKTFERLESNLKIQIIIDCSFLIGQKRANRSKVRIQDLSELEFCSRRLAHVLYVHRYSLLNKTV